MTTLITNITHFDLLGRAWWDHPDAQYAIVIHIGPEFPKGPYEVFTPGLKLKMVQAAKDIKIDNNHEYVLNIVIDAGKPASDTDQLEDLVHRILISGSSGSQGTVTFLDSNGGTHVIPTIEFAQLMQREGYDKHRIISKLATTTNNTE